MPGGIIRWQAGYFAIAIVHDHLNAYLDGLELDGLHGVLNPRIFSLLPLVKLPLENAILRLKTVPLEGDTVLPEGDVGISLTEPKYFKESSNQVEPTAWCTGGNSDPF